jgi:PGF-pre-PGF domain-containing protein
VAAALALILSVVVSPVTAETLTAEPISEGAAPHVDVGNATIDPSTDSGVPIAYNASGAVDTAADLELYLVNASSAESEVLAVNASLSSLNGIGALTVPAGAVRADSNVRATLANNSTGTPVPIANDTGAILANASEPASTTHISLADGTVFSDANTTLLVPYNATESVANASDVRVAVYNASAESTPVLAENASLRATEGTAALVVPAGAASANFTAEARLYDDSTDTPTALAVDFAAMTVTAMDGSGDSAPTSVSLANTSYDSSTDTTVAVPYDAGDAVADPANLTVELLVPNDAFLASNASLASLADEAVVTVPNGTVAGNLTVEARLLDTGSSNPMLLANDTAVFTDVASGGDDGDGEITPASVSLANTSYNSSTDTTVTVPYDAGDAVADPANLTVDFVAPDGWVFASNASLVSLADDALLTIPNGTVAGNLTVEARLVDAGSSMQVLLANDTAAFTDTASGGGDGDGDAVPPSIAIGNVTYDSTTETTLGVPYDAGSAVGDPTNLTIDLRAPDGTLLASNASLASLAGDALLTVPNGTVAGNLTVEARLLDAGASAPLVLANDTAVFTDVASGDDDGGAGGATIFLPDSTFDPTTETGLVASYDASGVVADSGDLTVLVVNASNSNDVWASNASLTTLSGEASLSIPAGTLDGDAAADALLLDADSNVVASDSAALTAETSEGPSGSEGDAIPPAPYVNQSAVTIDGTSDTTLSVTYNASGLVGGGADLAIELYNTTDGSVVATNASLTALSGHASVLVGSGSLGTTTDVETRLVDATNGTALASDVSTFTVTDGATPTVSVAPGINVTDQTTTPGASTTVDVAFDATGYISPADLNVTLVGPTGVVAYNDSVSTASGLLQLTIPASSTLGDYRIQTELVNDSEGFAWATDAATVTVQSSDVAVSFDSISTTTPYFNVPFYANATVTNTGGTDHTVRVSVYRDEQGAPANTTLLTVPAGGSATVNRTVTFTDWGDATGAESHTVTVNGESPKAVTVSPRLSVKSATVVGGTPLDDGHGLWVEGYVDDQPMLQLNLRSDSSTGSYDLSTIGADNTTLVRIDLTVESFTPRMLLGAGNVSNWTISPNGDGTTDVTVYVRPVEQQSIFPTPGLNDWPSGTDDRATDAESAAIGLAVSSLPYFDGQKQQRLSGTVLSTDAQVFGSPQYAENADGSASLSLFVGGPHYEKDAVNGQLVVNDGYYDAFLPDALLAHWGVTDPAQLSAAYAGSEQSIQITQVDGGWWVDIDIHYSSGSVQISSSSDSTPPVADAGSDRTVDEDTAVAFDGSNSTDDSGSIDSYEWDFDGDDAVDATGATPTHTFDQPGTYAVTLDVSDAAGNSDTDVVNVTVTDTTTPTAAAGSDQTVDDGSQVSLDGSSSTDNVEVTAYTWDFGDGSATASGATTTHTYATPGTYTVTLTVSDAAGNQDTDTLTVTVEDVTAPTAAAGPDRAADEDTAVAFDATSSTDDVGVTSYQWDFDGDDATDATGATSTHTFSDPGSYTVTLNVSDAAGNSDTDVVNVTVEDATAPTADAGSNRSVTVGTTVSFDGQGSSDNVGVTTYAWTFPDGTTATGTSATYAFDAAGVYAVTLDVTDAAGHENSDTVTITVTQPDSGSDSDSDSDSDGGSRDRSSGSTDADDSSDATGDDDEEENEPIDDGNDTGVSIEESEDGGQVNVTIGAATANETVVVSLESEDPASSNDSVVVDGVNISVTKNSSVALSIGVSDDAPDENATTSLSETGSDDPVGFLTVDHDVPEEDIGEVSFSFRVNRQRLADRGYDASDVVLYRYHGGEWQALATVPVGETDGQYLFRADSPGLSTFAVGTRAPATAIVDAALSTATVDIGQSVAVTATVENAGTAAGEVRLALTGDGASVDERTVVVAAGETTTVTLAASFDAAGEYTLAVGDVTAGTVTVESATTQTTTTTTETRTTTTTTTATESGGTPGFGVLGAVGSILLLVLLRSRRDADR